jgi:hypothetical protein
MDDEDRDRLFNAALFLYDPDMTQDELIELRIMAGTVRRAPLWMHRSRFWTWFLDLEYTRF